MARYRPGSLSTERATSDTAADSDEAWEMPGTTPPKRFFVKPLAIGLGGLIGVVGLVLGAWLLWGFLRPPPDGFAPTTGQAAGAADSGPAVLQYTIDARNRTDWAYFDFSRGRAVSTSQDTLDWDLAFSRTHILTNGGETNPDGLGDAIDLEKTPLEGATSPPDGYLADRIHEERGLENPTLRKWYKYNWISHVITSKNHTYALHTATGEVVLLTFTSYYCDDGSAGCITFRYAYPKAVDRLSGSTAH